MVRAGVLWVLLLAAQLESGTAQGSKRPLSIRDSIETSRILTFDGGGDGIRLSPDGSKYVLMIGRGDVQRDGVWMQILTGGTQSLEAAQSRTAARLFTRALGNVPVILLNQIAWLDDNERIALQWEDEQQRAQVMLFNVVSDELTQLTHHPTGVLQQAVDPRTGTVLYTSFAPHDKSASRRMRSTGFAVGDTAGIDFINGEIDGWDPLNHIELYVSTGPEKPPRQLTTPSRRGTNFTGVMMFSPKGRYALMVLPVDEAPAEWDQYTENYWTSYLLPRIRDGTDRSQLEQLYLIDTEHGSLRPFWNAPWMRATQTHLEWSADGRSVFIGPTPVPVNHADGAGLEGRAEVQVDIATGRITKHPFRSKQRVRSSAPIRMEVREDLNTPGALYAVEKKSGRERMILDLNPNLRNGISLGRVELAHWSGSDGSKWSGLLYYPVGYDPGKRYPVVMQTHGYSSTGFSLIGDERFPSVFGAQVLANRQIAVLQMGDPDPVEGLQGPSLSPREGKIYMAGFEGAVDFLSSLGIADRNRIGLTGFSRTGWHVEYALAHSRYPFAAAIAADNVDSSYLQGLLKPDWAPSFAQCNGGEPFSEGLLEWFKEVPAFNANKIRTPLRLQVNSGGLHYAMTHWEIFSRLKHLGRPVELYVIPNIEQGTHNLQNPAQLLASAGGAVDWFDFWLNEQEDADSSKTDQYSRWKNLRLQREATTGAERPIIPHAGKWKDHGEKESSRRLMQ